MNRESTSIPVPSRDKLIEEDLWQRHKAQRGVWSEAMLIALERGIKGNRWFSLIDKVRSLRTLTMAWDKVRANAGAPGVDGLTTGFYERTATERLSALQAHLTQNTYRPQAIRRTYIQKAGSKEMRPLGIPTVTDRIVQGAVKLVIEPIFEHTFAPSSYGFRPGRGCKEALTQVQRHLNAGLTHVVDVDIKGYFDAIPHELLMQLVATHIADGKVLGLIEAFLEQGVLEEGIETEPEQGSPQGGIISPLLANIYLNPLDWLLAEVGLQSVRYADDLIILASSAEAAQQALGRVQAWMERAKLTLHPEKTRVVDMNQPEAYFDYLGFRFMRTKKGKLIRLIRPKSQKKLRESLKKPTQRANGRSLEAIIAEINPRLQGWFTYFRAAIRGEHARMDQWVRMRLRSILRMRHKGQGRGRGLDHFKWPNHYFEKHGLFSLEEAWQKMMSLRSKGAKC
jgi:RNA-directed DNA polymerase